MLSNFSAWQQCILSSVVIISYLLRSEALPQHSDLFEQIEWDLHNFRDGISMDMVEQVYCSNNDPAADCCACQTYCLCPPASDKLLMSYLRSGFRSQAIDNKLYMAGEIVNKESRHRNRNVKLQLLELSRCHGIPDLDVYITVDDWPLTSQENVNPACPMQGPLLSQAKLDTRPHALLMPDWTFYDWSSDQNPGWADLKYILQAAANDSEWHTHLPNLFFRGSNDTGMNFVDQPHCLIYTWSGELQTSPVTCAGTRSFIIDADLEPYESLDIKAWYWPQHRDEFVSLVDHCKYKYLLNWPGHSYSARLKALLQCGSAVVYPSNDWYEFYYSLLQHGENIVMMKHLEAPSDVTHNLTAVVEVLKKFDAKAHQIGLAGQRLTQNILTPDNIQEYWMRLLTGYAQLMQFKPRLHADAISIGKSLTTTAAFHFNLSSRTCHVCGHYPSVGLRWDRNQ